MCIGKGRCSWEGGGIAGRVLTIEAREYQGGEGEIRPRYQ